jgi:hypothetical protein
MVPVNPATTILFGLLQSFTGVAGLTAGSGNWRILWGVVLLAGVAELVGGTVWARRWYVREVRGLSGRQDDRQSRGWVDASDDDRRDGWDPGRA